MADTPTKPSNGFSDIVNQFNEAEKAKPNYDSQVYREPYDIAGSFKKWTKEGYLPEVLTGAGVVGGASILNSKYRSLAKEEFKLLKNAKKAEIDFVKNVSGGTEQPFKGKTIVRGVTQTNPFENVAGDARAGQGGAESSRRNTIGTQANPKSGLAQMNSKELKELAKSNAKNRLFSWLQYVPDEIAQQKVPSLEANIIDDATGRIRPLGFTPEMYASGNQNYVMAKSPQSLPIRAINEYIPRTAKALWGMGMGVLNHPVVGNTLKGADAILTVPEAMNAYESASSGASRYDASINPTVSGLIAGSEPVAKTALNFYTGFAPALGNFGINQTLGRIVAGATGTPQSTRPEFDMLSFPYFVKGAPTLFNPYGGYGPWKDVGLQKSKMVEGMGGGTTVPLPMKVLSDGSSVVDFGISGPDGQIYGP
jgi:glutaredoxin-related protein